MCEGGLRSYRYRYAVSAIKLLIVKGPHLREGDGNLHFPSHPIPSHPPSSPLPTPPVGPGPVGGALSFSIPISVSLRLSSLLSVSRFATPSTATISATPSASIRPPCSHGHFFFFLPLFFFLPFLSRLPTRESGPRFKSSWRQSPYSAHLLFHLPRPATPGSTKHTDTEARAFRNLSPPYPSRNSIRLPRALHRKKKKATIYRVLQMRKLQTKPP